MPNNELIPVFFFNKFIYFFLPWVFVAVRGLSLVAAITLLCSVQASHCGGFSCCGAQALGAWASVVVACRLQNAGSVVVAHGLSCSAACGIFLDQGLNLCRLHWPADSSPLHHQGSPIPVFLKNNCSKNICFYSYIT